MAVDFPSGLDPDDLLRQEGRQALDTLLQGAGSLLDTLWQVEHEATPLSSPEDKAGFKQRLLDHTETIVDPDIRALYRRELTERFSAFAFPGFASFPAFPDLPASLPSLPPLPPLPLAFEFPLIVLVGELFFPA